MEKILVLDFGGQYDLLIARRVREQGVYAEIKPYNKITLDEIKENGYKGIIFTGGPNSVYDDKSPHYDPGILDIGVPVLGICYGMQLLAHALGGELARSQTREYGPADLEKAADCALWNCFLPEKNVRSDRPDKVFLPPR